MPLGPADSVSGTLDRGNCRLSDNTAYAEYSLVLPTRGQIVLEGSSTAFDLTLFLRDGSGHRIASGAAIQQPIERGQYSVLVNAGSPEQSGTYTLRSSFTPAPATICRDFAPVGLNQAAGGSLGPSSCLLPDGSRFDGYRLTSLGAGTLTVTMQSDEFAPLLIVRSADGHELDSSEAGGAGASAQVAVAIEANETYTIIASASGQVAGAYTLSVSFTPDDGESCVSLKRFTATDSAQGTISPDTSCPYRTPDPNATLYFNYYELEVTQAGVGEMRLATTDFNPYLQLLDSRGAVIQGDAYGGGIGNAILRQQLRPGIYTLQVFSLDDPGAYSLKYTLTPQLPADVLCPAAQVDAGNPVPGSLSDASCSTAEGFSQVYSLVLPQAGTLDLDLQSMDFVPLLSLRDAKDNRIVNDDNFGNITDSHITADLPAGTYTVVAATGGLPGSYTFLWQFTPHSLAPCAQVQKIDLNTAFVGVFGAGSCRGANGQPIDYYEITTPADGVVAAVMTSPAIDSYLTLQDAGGGVLRWDDNSYGGTDSLVVQFLPARTYRLAAQAADAISDGYYRLDVLFAPGSGPPGCTPLQAVEVGDTVQGNLTFTGCQYPDDTFADIYQLDLADTAALDLHLDSADFDAYLLVLDSKGNVVDEDDNSGGGTNARVIDTFDPGTYFVIAKPFSGYTAAGRYSLAINSSQ